MKNILRIVKIAKPLRPLIYLVALLIVLGALLDLVPPILSKFIVDEIVNQAQHHNGNLSALGFLVFLSFSISVLSQILGTASDRLGDHFAGKLRKFLTEKFYDNVLRLPQSYFDSEISGKIVHQLNRAIVTIENFINSGTNFVLPMVLQSVFTIVLLAFYNLEIAAFVLLLFPIYITLSYFSAKKWGEREIEKNALEDRLRGRINEVIGNIKLVKSFNRQKEEYTFVNSNLDKSNVIYAQQSNTFHKIDFIRNLSIIFIFLAINIIAFYNTFSGKLSIGTLVLILQLINQARRPLSSMSFVLSNIQRSEAGSKEYFEVLDLPTKEDYTQEPPSKLLVNPRLSFENVAFKYDNGETVLDNISFEIKAKETVALVGHSGAGKTTIVSLLNKFYDPVEGSIKLNDQDYRDLSANTIRANISLVLQDSEIFSSTVRENIAYAKKNASEEEILDALKKANAYDFVMNLPQGLESEVGERGVKLSGGQKQRLQIARAILKDAPILILDEATSSLDAKSEKEVHEALDILMENKLVIIIAHRFSTLQNAHRIIVVNQGKIVANGTPGELAKKDGIYADLLNYQIEGNKKLLESFEIY